VRSGSVIQNTNYDQFLMVYNDIWNDSWCYFPAEQYSAVDYTQGLQRKEDLQFLTYAEITSGEYTFVRDEERVLALEISNHIALNL